MAENGMRKPRTPRRVGFPVECVSAGEELRKVKTWQYRVVWIDLPLLRKAGRKVFHIDQRSIAM